MAGVLLIRPNDRTSCVTYVTSTVNVTLPFVCVSSDLSREFQEVNISLLRSSVLSFTHSVDVIHAATSCWLSARVSCC